MPPGGSSGWNSGGQTVLNGTPVASPAGPPRVERVSPLSCPFLSWSSVFLFFFVPCLFLFLLVLPLFLLRCLFLLPSFPLALSFSLVLFPFLALYVSLLPLIFLVFRPSPSSSLSLSFSSRLSLSLPSSLSFSLRIFCFVVVSCHVPSYLILSHLCSSCPILP